MFPGYKTVKIRFGVVQGHYEGSGRFKFVARQTTTAAAGRADHVDDDGERQEHQKRLVGLVAYLKNALWGGGYKLFFQICRDFPKVNTKKSIFV